jgi:hypothetical protein
MTAIRFLGSIFLFVCGLPLVAMGLTIVATQPLYDTDEAFWLLNLDGQQGDAHSLINSSHPVHTLNSFTFPYLYGVSILYFSPYYGSLSGEELDAIESFVESGGRLIFAMDHSGTSPALGTLAARFGVSYGSAYGNPGETHIAMTINPPSGPWDIVESFSTLAPNGGLSSTNPDFQVLAEFPDGVAALAYLPVGSGDVVFLVDQNTFDDARLYSYDNLTLWLNLFVLHESVGTELRTWGGVKAQFID